MERTLRKDVDRIVDQRRRRGMTLIEVVVAIAIVGVLVGLATLSLDGMFTDQRVKAAARDVADALMLGRAEAIRSGNTHLVVFQNALGATEPIVIVDDGLPATANCTIDAGELKHSWEPVEGISWGTSTGLANGAAAPDDPGGSPATIATGSSFTNATGPAAPATWVLFQPDGFPRLFSPSGGSFDDIGRLGTGWGGIYLTNTRRDYAVVLSNLGSVRVHAWTGSGWRK